MTTPQILYGLSIVLTGLVAGLFYAYQCSVINGLGAADDKTYLSAFQEINRAILNPVFFLSFMGALIILPITTYVVYRTGQTQLFTLLLIATFLYVVGGFMLTVIGNIPLNNLLDSYKLDTASASDLRQMRLDFEGSWNRWHLIRTIATIASFVTLILPLIKKM